MLAGFINRYYLVWPALCDSIYFKLLVDIIAAIIQADCKLTSFGYFTDNIVKYRHPIG